MQIQKPDFGLEAFLRDASEAGLETEISSSKGYTILRVKGDDDKNLENPGDNILPCWRIPKEADVYAVLNAGRLVGIKYAFLVNEWVNIERSIVATVFTDFDLIFRYENLPTPYYSTFHMSVTYDPEANNRLQNIEDSLTFYKLFTLFPIYGFVRATFWPREDGHYYFRSFGCAAHNALSIITPEGFSMIAPDAGKREPLPYTLEDGAVVNCFYTEDGLATLSIETSNEQTEISCPQVIPEFQFRDLGILLASPVDWITLPRLGLIRGARQYKVELPVNQPTVKL